MDATVSDITAEHLHRVSKVIVHPLTVRITHWLNALAMVIMIMSGWRIYNSDPILPFYFPVELTLGGSYEGSVDIHNEDGLAGALQWHFAGMWLLTINGIVYLAYGILSGHFRRAFFPVGPRAVLRDAVAALKFQLPHQLGVYNAVQKTLYLGVLAAGVITVLSGLAIWKPGQFQELTFLFGGFDVARIIHFLGMARSSLFLIVHVALVIIVPKTLPAMITGRAPAHGTRKHEGPAQMSSTRRIEGISAGERRGAADRAPALPQAGSEPRRADIADRLRRHRYQRRAIARSTAFRDGTTALRPRSSIRTG